MFANLFDGPHIIILGLIVLVLVVVVVVVVLVVRTIARPSSSELRVQNQLLQQQLDDQIQKQQNQGE